MTIMVLGIFIAVLTFCLELYFKEFVIQHFHSIADQMVDKNGVEPGNIEKFYSIGYHNSLIGLIIILVGFIPIYGFPVIYGLISFTAVGVVAGYGYIMDYDVIKTMMIAFVPHAIIEIIPILYSMAVGMYINKNIIKRLYLKKNNTSKLGTMCKKGMKSYLLIVVPLFLLAALVESFITTFLIDRYL
ncbi:stage II sporulation protein M [Peribacillus sp. NPDC006672]|uniref:stage II sporulation protein M n=1 Tax=Peribacillus sp. NPDC006672 TaxID=3390606 RepID=UPI003D030BC8